MASARLKTEREVAKLKSPGRHSVGGNLVLQVSRNGSRSWIARVTDHLGRRRDIGLGSVLDVTLSIARERVRLARSAVAQGYDPVEALRPTPTPTFETVARKFHEEREATFSNRSGASGIDTSICNLVVSRIAASSVMALKIVSLLPAHKLKSLYTSAASSNAPARPAF